MLLRFIPYILKTLWRHRARTILTVSGSAVALLVFCLVGSAREAMQEFQKKQESDRSLVVFQANKFCPATSHLPQDYDRTIRRIEGVRDVVPIQVFTNNCRASLDVVVFHGMPKEQIRQVRRLDLFEGDWSAFEQRQDAALVGAAVARRRGLTPGGNFSIGGITVTVAGVFRSGEVTEENYVYTGLDFLQRRGGASRVGTVTQLEVLLEPGADPEAVARRVDETFRGGPAATATRPKSAFQAKALGDLAELIRMARYLGHGCVGLVLLLVATTTVMSVQDRFKEHAVLQTIGFSPLRLFLLVVFESVLLGLSGGILGVLIATAVLQFGGLAVGAEGVMMAFRPSTGLVTTGIAVALASGVLAGLAPAWQATRAEIVPALRQA